MKQKPLINYDYRHHNSSSTKKEWRPRFAMSPMKYTLIFIATLLGIIITVVIAQPNPEPSPASEITITNEKPKLVTSSLDLNLTSRPSSQSALPTSIISPANNQVTPLRETSIAPPPLTKSLPEAEAKVDASWKTLKVKPGDTLAKLLSRAGLGPQQIHELITTDKNTKKLTKIFPGDIFKVQVNEKGDLQQLTHELDEIKKLNVSRIDGTLSSKIIKLPVDIRLAFSHGTITSSLFLAAQASGLSDKSTMELAGIFGWDIDFALDIREGDSFSVLHEELFRDGKKLRDGVIVAAEFTNKNNTYTAVRFKASDGFANYYSAEGHSMRKTFLRTPVEFSRISSKFNLRRKHPVLNKIRSHKGVDYAASTGTPIRATADGKVVFRGTRGGYGKTIVLQHGSKYSTLYAHMSRYAKGTRNTKKVRQGQVIGYIGMTGLATGPHLHYEFRVDGVHRNPLTVKFPKAEPLAKKYRKEFNKSASALLTQLESRKQTQLALSNKN